MKKLRKPVFGLRWAVVNGNNVARFYASKDDPKLFVRWDTESRFYPKVIGTTFSRFLDASRVRFYFCPTYKVVPVFAFLGKTYAFYSGNPFHGFWQSMTDEMWES